MQEVIYHPYVETLLINHSNEKVEVLYDSNDNAFKLPKISKRPPYYWNPSYVEYMPLI